MGSRSRRWTEAEIRRAVKRVGKTPIRGIVYIEARKTLDVSEYPTYDTARRRCPDLFKS